MVVAQQPVITRRLDGIVAEFSSLLPAEPRIFLKTDTQGFDLNVFRGVGTALGLLEVIQCEISVLPIYDGAPGYLAAVDEFGAAGFVPISFVPVTRDCDTLFAIEFDCLLMRLPRIHR